MPIECIERVNQMAGNFNRTSFLSQKW